MSFQSGKSLNFLKTKVNFSGEARGLLTLFKIIMQVVIYGAVVLAGAKPVLVDIDPSNLCLDLELTRRAITPRTRAIMYVSINGRCPDMESVVALACEKKLYLVEDAAQSLGSRCKGRHLGTFGEIGSFSFSVPKIITTGQGGALVTTDEEIYEKIRRIKDFGRSRGGVDYHEIMGFNAKFTDLQSVIGIEQMKKLDWRVKRKKEMFQLYRELLSEVKQVEFIETNLYDCSPWFIDILIDGEGEREKLVNYLSEKGIGLGGICFIIFQLLDHLIRPILWQRNFLDNLIELFGEKLLADISL